MTAQSGLGFSGIVAIQIPDNGATGEVLTKLTGDNYDYDWAPGGGGGGGQVNTVVGGVNITVNAGDPVNPIVNLDAAITGTSVNGVTLSALGVATNFLNETGAYSVPPVDTVTADAIYLRLDTTNNPLTGDLEFNTGGDAVIYNSFLDGDFHFDVNNTTSGVNTRAMTITAQDLIQGGSSIDMRPSDTCYLSNFIFMQNNIELVNSESGFGSTITWRLDNAVPTAPLRIWGVGTTDPGFGSMSMGLGFGAADTSLNFAGAFDVDFTIPSGQIFTFDGPITLDQTLSPAVISLTLADTFTTGGAFIGGGIQSTGTVTYNNTTFIWALLAENKFYSAAAAPGFAAFTLFNALPVIQNSGNNNLVAALILNNGLQYRRITSGTSTIANLRSISHSAIANPTVSGAVLTYTGQEGLYFGPNWNSPAGTTINFGTLRAVACAEPTTTLFGAAAGTRNLTAYIGLDFPNFTFFTGTQVINVVRSALNAATNRRFLNHTGTALSFLGGGLTMANTAPITFGTASPVVLDRVAADALRFTGAAESFRYTFSANLVDVTSTTGVVMRFSLPVDINAPIALGGGAAATLGTIGGAGPTAAAQAQWIQVQVNGVNHWIAAWT